MSAQRRTDRDWRRRQFGQNFLDPATAEQIVDQAGLTAGELVVEIGAGAGAFTRAMARRGVRLMAIEADPVWAQRLRAEFSGHPTVHVMRQDVIAFRWPREPFRVLGSLPFGRTTDILRKLLDDPATPLRRADIVLQWEVALKRAETPPTTLLSTAWAPWWQMQLAGRIPATKFRPRPRVDGGLLVVTRRDPPLLPATMAPSYGAFVHQAWPFDQRRRGPRG